MEKPTLYLIPGLLTNEYIYRGLRKDLYCSTKVLEFIPPKRFEPIEDYARRLAEGIDESKPFSLLGTSFGGILAIEISKFTNPDHLIIISSAKDRNEFNWSMKQKRLGIVLPYIPAWLIRIIFVWGFLIASWLIPAYKKVNIPEIRKMLKSIDGKLERWVMRKITLWQNKNHRTDILHIHGDKDKVFPVRKIKNAHIIKRGTHGMILTKYKHIARLVNNRMDLQNKK